MTFLSRLSAAWRAFRKDDFPPTLKDSIPPIRSEADYINEFRVQPSMADECEALRKEQEAMPGHPTKGIGPTKHHPLCAAIYGKDCTCKPIGNVEVVKTPGIRRRNKLASVKPK